MKDVPHAMKKLVVFDADGTLVDSAGDIAASIAYAATTVCGLPDGTFTLDQTLPLLGKHLDETFRLLLAPEYHPRVAECVAAYRLHYRANMARTTRPFPGILPLLVDLRHHKVRLAIATTKIQPTIDYLVTALDIGHYFERVQGTDGFPNKPDPYILHLLMRDFDVSPADTIMIGDTDNDVLCAQRAGVEVVAVTWGGAWSEAQLAALDPTYIARNVDELRAILGVSYHAEA